MRKLLRAARRGLFIQSLPTPNPNAVKLVPAGRRVLLEGSADFASPQQARASPLADRLFAVAGVERVFLSAHYLTVTKSEGAEWEELKPALYAAVEQGLEAGAQSVAAAPAADDADTEVVRLIKEIIETRVRPFVQEDGGDLSFDHFDEGDGVVWVALKGSCSGCPSSSVTLRQGVERMLTHYVPEVTEVRSVDGDEGGE